MTNSRLGQQDNVIDFIAARDERASSPRDKRASPRREAKERLFAQVISCDAQQALSGTTLACSLCETSLEGLRFSANRCIPVGSRLDLWVDVPFRPGKFFLSGEVVWSKTLEDGAEMGVSLSTNSTSDINEWQTFHRTAAAQ